MWSGLNKGWLIGVLLCEYERAFQMTVAGINQAAPPDFYAPLHYAVRKKELPALRFACATRDTVGAVVRQAVEYCDRVLAAAAVASSCREQATDLIHPDFVEEFALVKAVIEGSRMIERLSTTSTTSDSCQEEQRTTYLPIDLNLRGGKGRQWTALHLAAKLGHVSVMKLLLEGGADPLEECEFTEPPSRSKDLVAPDVQAGDVDNLVPLLLACGADPALQERTTGWTSLHLAVNAGNVSVVRQLLDPRGDGGEKTASLVNTGDRFGWLPIYEAASRADRDCVRLLLERGAQANFDAIEKDSDDVIGLAPEALALLKEEVQAFAHTT
eukprot:g15051.t1